MGILANPEPIEQKAASTKRKPRQIDFANLAPLKPKNTSGFSGYREGLSGSPSQKAGKPIDDDDDMDSDDEVKANGSKRSPAIEAGNAMQDDDDDVKPVLSAEEIAKRGELAEGVKKIQVCSWDANCT